MFSPIQTLTYSLRLTVTEFKDYTAARSPPGRKVVDTYFH